MRTVGVRMVGGVGVNGRARDLFLVHVVDQLPEELQGATDFGVGHADTMVNGQGTQERLWGQGMGAKEEIAGMNGPALGHRVLGWGTRSIPFQPFDAVQWPS